MLLINRSAMCWLVIGFFGLVGLNTVILFAECSNTEPASGPCTSCDQDYLSTSCPESSSDCTGNQYTVNNDGLSTSSKTGSKTYTQNAACLYIINCQTKLIDGAIMVCGPFGTPQALSSATRYYSNGTCPPEA